MQTEEVTAPGKARRPVRSVKEPADRLARRVSNLPRARVQQDGQAVVERVIRVVNVQTDRAAGAVAVITVSKNLVIVAQHQRVARAVAVETNRRQLAAIQFVPDTRPALGKSSAKDGVVRQTHP